MKKVVLTAISAALLFSFISCGSKPAPEETEQPSAPTVTEPEESAVEQETVPETVEEPDTTAEDEAARKAEEERLAKLAEERKAAMEALENARSIKQRIDEEELAEFDQKKYDIGCENLELVENALGSSDELDESLFDAAKKAYGAFLAVFNAAYKEYAKEARADAYQAKLDADSVKAGVAKKVDYQTAAETFTKGDTLYAMQSPEKAYDCYVEAEELFIDLYNEVFEKRAAAKAAIDSAKRRVEETALFAEEADVKAPIMEEELDGIEDEDTVLLEEDEYDDPGEAIVDIPEELEGAE